MNKVMQMGRITKDIDLRFSQAAEPLAVAKFGLAVAKKFKRQGEPEVDFFNCVAFGKTAENINNFFSKGKMIFIIGSLKTGNYEKDGRKIYTTDIVVDEFFFTGEKKEETPKPSNGDFFAIDENLDDEDLPF